MKTPKLVEVDLSKTTTQGSKDLRVGPQYLCLIGRHLFVGQFSKQWYGLNFDGWYNNLQYDPPGTNSSDWRQVWRIEIRP